MTKWNPWYLAAIASVAPLGAMGGMLGVAAGHAAVLVITLSIFIGTLSLGRTTMQQPSSALKTPIAMEKRDALKRLSLVSGLAWPRKIRLDSSPCQPPSCD